MADKDVATLLDLHGSMHRPGRRLLAEDRSLASCAQPKHPHAIRYNLTLHESYGRRILGFDNAHAIKPPKKFKYAGRVLPYDHKHRHPSDKGVLYGFTTAHQLLSDFFDEVDRVLDTVRSP